MIYICSIYASCVSMKTVWITSISHDYNSMLTETFAFTQNHLRDKIVAQQTCLLMLSCLYLVILVDIQLIFVGLVNQGRPCEYQLYSGESGDDPLKSLQIWCKMARTSHQTKTVPSLTRCCHSVILRSSSP